VNLLNTCKGGNEWATTPLSEMADALRKCGIIVVTSNGNGGVEGIFEFEGALLGRETMPVASIENTHYLSFKAYDISDKNFSIGYKFYI
jgi:hypothetical protein